MTHQYLTDLDHLVNTAAEDENPVPETDARKAGSRDIVPLGLNFFLTIKKVDIETIHYINV
jgi:hypothetical protein